MGVIQYVKDYIWAVSIQLSALRFYCFTSLSPVAGTNSPSLRVAVAVPM